MAPKGEIRDHGLAAALRDFNDTDAKMERFLEALRDGYCIAEAERRIGVSHGMGHYWRRRYPEFRDAVQHAKTVGRRARVSATTGAADTADRSPSSAAGEHPELPFQSVHEPAEARSA